MKLFLVRMHVENVRYLFSNEGEWIPEETHKLEDLFVCPIFEAAKTLADCLAEYNSEKIDVVTFHMHLRQYLELLGVQDELLEFFQEFENLLLQERNKAIKKPKALFRRKRELENRSKRMFARKR